MCQGCPGHSQEPQDILVDIKITFNDASATRKYDRIRMSEVQSPGRTFQFKDAEGYLHIFLLGANDRVEITTCEPLPEQTEDCEGCEG